MNKNWLFDSIIRINDAKELLIYVHKCLLPIMKTIFISWTLCWNSISGHSIWNFCIIPIQFILFFLPNGITFNGKKAVIIHTINSLVHKDLIYIFSKATKMVTWKKLTFSTRSTIVNFASCCENVKYYFTLRKINTNGYKLYKIHIK